MVEAVCEVDSSTCVDPAVDLRIKEGCDLDKVVFLKSAASKRIVSWEPRRGDLQVSLIR